MKRMAILYFVTLAIMVPLDILFLGFVARDFFKSQVGDMLGDLKLLPAIVFYLVYAAGIVVFVSAGLGDTPRTALLYGALFGAIAYATFDLTTLAILRHWTWSAAAVDVAWGAFVTAISAAGGLLAVLALERT